MTPQQQNALSTVNSIQTPTAPAASNGEPEPNFIERLLPTGGSILGGIAGGLLGPLGMVGGSALGSALGKGAEDLFTGGQGGLGTAAIEGGVGGALGGVGGSLLGKLGGGLSDMAANTTASKAVQDGVGLLPGKLLGKLHAPEVMDWAKSQGIDLSPSGLSQASIGANGPEGAYNNVIKEALDQVKPQLNLQAVKDDANAALGQKTILGDPNATVAKGKSLVPVQNDATSLQSQINDLLDPIANPMRNQNLQPGDARQVLQDVGTEAASYRNIARNAEANGAENAVAKAKANVLSTVYNSLKGQLYNGDVDKFISDYHVEPGSVNYNNILQAAGGNDKLAANFTGTINNAGSTQDLLDEMSKLADAGKLGKAGQTAQDVAALKGGATEPGVSPQEAAAAIVGGHHTLIPAVLKKVIPTQAMTAIAGAGGKVAQTGVAKGAIKAVAQLLAHAPSDFNPTPQDGSLTGQLGGTAMQPGNVQGGSILANGSPTSGTNILSQLDAMLSADPLLASSLAPAIQGLAPQAQSAQAAQQALQQYMQTLQAAGGAQGPLQGILTRLGSLFTGGPASQLGGQQQAAQALMAKAGAPGIQLPGLYANQAGAQAGLGQAQSVLGALGAQ